MNTFNTYFDLEFFATKAKDYDAALYTGDIEILPKLRSKYDLMGMHNTRGYWSHNALRYDEIMFMLPAEFKDVEKAKIAAQEFLDEALSLFPVIQKENGDTGIYFGKNYTEKKFEFYKKFQSRASELNEGWKNKTYVNRWGDGSFYETVYTRDHSFGVFFTLKEGELTPSLEVTFLGRGSSLPLPLAHRR